MNALAAPRPDRDPSLDHLVVAGTEFARVVGIMSESDWNLPTPCPRWDVRTLVAHTLSIAEGLVHMAYGNDVPPQVRVDDVHGPRHTADRFAIAIERGRRAWEDAPLDEMRDFPWGRTPARRLLELSTVEFVAHGWDLATAIDAVISIPGSTIRAATLTVESGLRDVAPPGDFATAVHVPEGTPALDRFAALLGRTP